MKAIERLFSEQSRREIDEELGFHLDLLTQEHLQSDMSLNEAQATALKRFGDVERIKDQCFEISRRSSLLTRVMKSFFILVFLVGVAVRIFSPEFHVTRIGNLLIAVGILGRLFFYVRALGPTSVPTRHETSSSLRLNENPQTSFTVYDKTRRMPVERVILNK